MGRALASAVNKCASGHNQAADLRQLRSLAPSLTDALNNSNAFNGVLSPTFVLALRVFMQRLDGSLVRTTLLASARPSLPLVDVIGHWNGESTSPTSTQAASWRVDCLKPTA